MANHRPPLIAHVIYALATGGLENGLINIINRTPSDRYRHVIICITHADAFAQRITANDVSVIELHKREGHDLQFYLRLWQVFRELRPDIIHSRNLAALESQLLGIGLFGVKRVHGEHGREVADLDGQNWKYLSFRKFMRAFIHCYVTVSKDLENWLLETVAIDPRKVRQIYNGVDQGLFIPIGSDGHKVLPVHWQDETPKLIVGTVGRLSPVKDQRTLIHAIGHVREIAPVLFEQVRLLIVGDGPLRRSLDDLVEDLGLQKTIWLTGDRNDVPALLASMDVFVLPSLGEGISNTMLEAMACGLPVIATAVGGNVELVEEGFNGRLVPAADAHALAQTLVKMLDNPVERTQLGRNARHRACQRFDWNRTVDDYLCVYDELLQLPAAKTIKSVS